MPSLTIAIPQDGPLVQMMVGVSPARASALRAVGGPVPSHVSGRGLQEISMKSLALIVREVRGLH